MNLQKIVPNLWFNAYSGNISKVFDYYKNIFCDDFETGPIIRLGTTPGGNTEMCEVFIFKQKYIFLNTENGHHPMNDSVSLMINCRNQDEIYKLSDYFTREGKESQCGWCIDKFGLSKQVLPENLHELMSRPNAFEVMSRQMKIEMDEY